jgi:hypothetical protein
VDLCRVDHTFYIKSLCIFSRKRVIGKTIHNHTSIHLAAPDPCAVLNCFLRLHSVEQCRREQCCYRWMREARERWEREHECPSSPSPDAPRFQSSASRVYNPKEPFSPPENNSHIINILRREWRFVRHPIGFTNTNSHTIPVSRRSL